MGSVRRDGQCMVYMVAVRGDIAVPAQDLRSPDVKSDVKWKKWDQGRDEWKNWDQDDPHSHEDYKCRVKILAGKNAGRLGVVKQRGVGEAYVWFDDGSGNGY